MADTNAVARLVPQIKRHMSTRNSKFMDQDRWVIKLAELYEKRRYTYRVVGAKYAGKMLAREISRIIEEETSKKTKNGRKTPKRKDTDDDLPRI